MALYGQRECFYNIVEIDTFFYLQLLKHKCDVNFVNEHGNTALHYACFWNYPAIAEDLVKFSTLLWW
jgi:ankyrin repeat protein